MARLLLERSGRVTVAPCRHRETRERLAFELEACPRAAWSVDSDGRDSPRADAINAALACALDTQAALHVDRLPLMDCINDRAYGAVA